MPTTLTLKNMPDEVYERLKAAAESHRRSLNSEAIVCQETVLLAGRLAPGERLALAMKLGTRLHTMDRKLLRAFRGFATALAR